MLPAHKPQGSDPLSLRSIYLSRTEVALPNSAPFCLQFKFSLSSPQPKIASFILRRGSLKVFLELGVRHVFS